MTRATRRKAGKGQSTPNERAFRQAISRWYKQDGRRYPWRLPSASLYVQIVSEVLLQRTRADAVEKFFPQFLDEFPSWSILSNASVIRIGQVLKPVGLWRRRARSLKSLALRMSRRRGRFPAERFEIDSLPGVGQYIGNAIELFAHGRARPLLDSGMARVLERYFGPRQLVDIRYDPYLQDLAQRVVADKDCKTLNWAILDLSALVCTREPLCETCPLSAGCMHATEDLRSRRQTGVGF